MRIHRATGWVLAGSVNVFLSLAALAVEEERSKDPDPAKGTKDRSGRTVCKFVTQAVKDGKEVEVPYEADFWLPPGYETDTDRRYPVIYVFQNMDLPRKNWPR